MGCAYPSITRYNLMNQYLEMFLRVWKTQKAAKLAKRVSERLCTRLARLAMKPLSVQTNRDPYHLLFQRFVKEVSAIDGARLIEIGSRSRTGSISTHGFSPSVHYQGVDILRGQMWILCAICIPYRSWFLQNPRMRCFAFLYLNI